MEYILIIIQMAIFGKSVIIKMEKEKENILSIINGKIREKCYYKNGEKIKIKSVKYIYLLQNYKKNEKF